MTTAQPVNHHVSVGNTVQGQQEQDDGFLVWVISQKTSSCSVHTLTLKLTSITFFDFKFWFLLFVFSFLASRNRISLSPRRAERCSAVHWRTGQSNVMFVKTAGCCRWCKILWISSGLKGLEQSDSAMVWKTQQPNRRRCDNVDDGATVIIDGYFNNLCQVGSVSVTVGTCLFSK